MRNISKNHKKVNLEHCSQGFILSSAQDPDPLDPQDFGFLDPDPDPQKYADPRIWIQGKIYQPKTATKQNFNLKTQI